MILHIFCNTGSYPVEAANFISVLDKDRNHVFAFRNWDENNSLSNDALSRTYRVDSKKKLVFQLTPMLKKADRVFFHSFTIGIALFYWIFAIRKITSAWLAVYGTEIYWRKYAAPSVWNMIQEGMRKMIFRRIRHVITAIEPDYERFRTLYAPGAIHIKAFLPIPGNLPELQCRPSQAEKGDRFTVLLGNSSTPTNQHIAMLEQLAGLPFGAHLKIICPLSYGDPGYAREVTAVGIKLFEDRFEALREFMNPAAYIEVLYGVDLAIMNHDRQQALGNIFTLLCMGKKVYIRSDNPASGFFREQGLAFGRTEELIADIGVADMVLSEEQANGNHELMKKLLSDEHYREMWLTILNIHD